MSEFSAILAFSSSILGPTNSTPNVFSFSMFSATIGCLYMDSCMAGTIIIGTPDPKAVETTDVTGVSSIPHAILLMVLAVAGATRTKSALLVRLPTSATCSTLPVNSVTTGFPVAHSIRYGWIIFLAISDMTAKTSARYLIRPLAISEDRTAATLPVMHKTTLFPFSASPAVPVISLEG